LKNLLFTLQKQRGRPTHKNPQNLRNNRRAVEQVMEIEGFTETYYCSVLVLAFVFFAISILCVIAYFLEEDIEIKNKDNC